MTKNPDMSLEMGFQKRFVITMIIKAVMELTFTMTFLPMYSYFHVASIFFPKK